MKSVRNYSQVTIKALLLSEHICKQSPMFLCVWQRDPDQQASVQMGLLRDFLAINIFPLLAPENQNVQISFVGAANCLTPQIM